MRKPIFLLIPLLMLLTTGCWDAKDIKNMAIPIIGGYDYVADAKNKYRAYIDFPVFGGSKKYDTVMTEGETLGETRIDRGNKVSRIVSIGDLRGVLLGKEMALHGTEGVFDILFRNPQVGGTQRIMVVDGSAKEVFELKPKHYRTIGEQVVEMMENSAANNFVPDEDLHNFRINVLTPGFNPVLPVIHTHDEDKLMISGAALFKKYKMVAMVNQEDMRVLTWLRGEQKKGDILFDLTDEKGETNRLTFEGGNTRSVKAKMQNGKPVFEVEIQFNGYIVEDLGDFEFAGKEEHIKLAQKALENKVKTQCESFINDLQNKYRVDAILLGKYARITWPDLTEKQDWDEVFCNSIIKVKVKAVIMGTGEVA